MKHGSETLLGKFCQMNETLRYEIYLLLVSQIYHKKSLLEGPGPTGILKSRMNTSLNVFRGCHHFLFSENIRENLDISIQFMTFTVRLLEIKK